ncbi:hypothetical protein AG1IA_10315 [Rhizoctonia solani AG-1 IA]|uniref:Uncharacterized protein n=1 Tax=Thanatephorus cucumeris (strain AG1-IA) TaxID=983506 RepID=L8WCH5_THACA|nr:hypothetical protein AG1IA_10315 [Rhizoctonia solani AG-1 IA]
MKREQKVAEITVDLLCLSDRVGILFDILLTHGMLLRKNTTNNIHNRIQGSYFFRFTNLLVGVIICPGLVIWDSVVIEFPLMLSPMAPIIVVSGVMNVRLMQATAATRFAITTWCLRTTGATS